jgi:TRAP-type C4-dicarboxylate transport system substrate-binding protein
MPFTQAVFDALAQGTLDAQENTITTIWEFEVFKQQKYLSLTGHIYSPAIIFMSGATHDKLSDVDKQAFVVSAGFAGNVARERIDDYDGVALAQLLSVGMRINDDVDKAAFQAALAAAYAGWRERFGDLIDRIQAYG